MANSSSTSVGNVHAREGRGVLEGPAGQARKCGQMQSGLRGGHAQEG
jgi:hypothetical protein